MRSIRLASGDDTVHLRQAARVERWLEGLIADAEGAWLITDTGEAPVAWGESMVRDVADSCREMARCIKGQSETPIRGRVAS